MGAQAQVIVVASQKGGSGKTTLSGHLAVEAERTGAGPVALIDTDPQGSLAKWWNARAAQAPAFARATVPDLGTDIEALKAQGYRLIVIDTPPAVTSTIAEVISHADLVILPTRPSPHDLRAVGATVDIIEYQHKPLVFVINAATARARITGDSAVVLSQHGTVAPITLHHRVDYAASMIDGRTIGEVNPSSKSAKEIEDLWSYFADRLARMRGDTDVLLERPRLTFETALHTPTIVDKATVKLAEDATSFHAPAHADKPAAAAIVEEARAQQEAAPWEGVERRKADFGPPPGMPDRRKSAPVFGRRGIDLVQGQKTWSSR